MGWESRRNGKTYYYRKVWRQGRVRSEYVGAGPVATLLADLEAVERERQALGGQAKREEQAMFEAQTRAPAELEIYATDIRRIVAEVLRRLGFHQHHGQWRRRRMTELAQVNDEAIVVAAHSIYCKHSPSAEELAEFRRLLSEHTVLARLFGDTAILAQQAMMHFYQATPALAAAVQGRIIQIADDLGYAEASELERLLIDEITLRWLDLYRMQTAYAKRTDTSTLNELERWERVLALKQARYLKAIEALARVRRLLKLPAVQVNVATAGGQQVNIQGEVSVKPYRDAVTLL